MKKIIFCLAIAFASFGMSEAKASATKNDKVSFKTTESKSATLENTELKNEVVETNMFQGTICTFYVGEPYLVWGFSGWEVWRDIRLDCWSCSYCPGDVINTIEE